MSSEKGGSEGEGWLPCSHWQPVSTSRVLADPVMLENFLGIWRLAKETSLFACLKLTERSQMRLQDALLGG